MTVIRDHIPTLTPEQRAQKLQIALRVLITHPTQPAPAPARERQPSASRAG